jgi:hypothetical protein
MAKKENGRELLRQDNESLRKQFIDCRNLLEKEREENQELREEALKYRAIEECFHKKGDYQIIHFMRDVKAIITGIPSDKRKPMT